MVGFTMTEVKSKCQCFLVKSCDLNRHCFKKFWFLECVLFFTCYDTAMAILVLIQYSLFSPGLLLQLV